MFFQIFNSIIEVKLIQTAILYILKFCKNYLRFSLSFFKIELLYGILHIRKNYLCQTISQLKR
jgi:hypothetical protein